MKGLTAAAKSRKQLINEGKFKKQKTASATATAKKS